jgi:2-dehydro-3-deoxygalactonokinase
MNSKPRRVLCDWGSSRLRAYLDVDGAIVDRREGPGIAAARRVPPLVALRRTVDPWRTSGDFDQIILCGMVGSRNGLVEVPYVSAPIGSSDWAERSSSHRKDELEFTIAPGVCGHSALGTPDVMRGEEAQIFGAFLCHSPLAQGDHVVLLPGTHSKWVNVGDGRILSFQTFITGELFALLRDRSSLMLAGESKAEPDAGFTEGLQRSSRAGLAESLFETRSAQLLLGRTRGWAEGFLSGVLIGDEIASISRTSSIRTVILIGEPKLSALYRQALEFNGIETKELDADQCVVAGLRLVADHLAGVG